MTMGRKPKHGLAILLRKTEIGAQEGRKGKRDWGYDVKTGPMKILAENFREESLEQRMKNFQVHVRLELDNILTCLRGATLEETGIGVE